MPKMKTNSSAKKRFKKLASGLVKRSRSHHRHLLSKKSANRKRFLREGAYVGETDMKRIAQLLPY